MPFLTLLGIFLIVGGFIGIFNTNRNYKIRQGQLSFASGTELPLYSGESKGVLKMGNVIVSKDRKHAAVEIKYADERAKKELSAFGKNYKIYVLTQKKYPTSGLKIKYGFFGTDGSGVLQISSPEPFINQAFVVMLADKTFLTSTSELTTSTVSDYAITKTITAQLADGTTDTSYGSSSANSESSRSRLNIPFYYLRVNPGNITSTTDNWNGNEKELVKLLFVNKNLKKIENNLNDDRKKLKLAKQTLKEYNERLKANPEDTIAESGKREFESNITTLENDIQKELENYNKLKSYDIKDDILGSQQTKYNLIKTDNISKLDGTSSAN